MIDLDILHVGIFDSQKLFPNVSESAKRTVDTFEFDYILSCTNNSVSFINADSHKLSPGLIVARKPGDISHSKYHYRSYSLYITSGNDSEIYRELMKFPSYFPMANTVICQNFFSDMFRHLVKSNENYTSFYAYSKTFDFLHYLKKSVGKKPFDVTKKESLSIQKAANYIKENFAQNITLEFLGKLTGYSPNHFRNLFSSAMNLSPQKYLEKIRIDYAKFLLAKGEMPIAEIAYTCGFSSQSYFTKTFKELTGETPGEFSKKAYIRYGE